ncbi:MAG: hypothetical protein FK731_11005 [Asgard group archaeon]|nr:hypothetical protein [Asgard group archaeon]
MNKIIFSISILIIFIITFLSGCQQQGTITDDTLNNVMLESDLVELVYSIINFNKDDQNKIFSVEVQYRFRNIANRNIEINVFAEFYDIKDNLLAKEGPKEIYIPKGWTEQGISPANILTYYGENAAEVDYVKLIVEGKI